MKEEMKPMHSNVYPVGDITTLIGTTPNKKTLINRHRVPIMQDK